MTMTGSAGWLARICVSSSSPLRPGMRISVISTSGRSRRNAASAVSAWSNAVGAIPPWRSARSSTQRIEASSSTSQTLRGFTEVDDMEGQQDRKLGQAGPALELDQAIVTAHQVLRDREPESGAIRTPGDERIEQRLAQVVGHARPVVFELHARDQAMTAGADVHVGQRARAQYDATLAAVVLRDRLQRVAAEVEHRLDDQIAIQRQRRQARIVVALDRHGRRRIGCEQVAHVLQQLVNVRLLATGRVARTEERVDESGEAIGLADDHRGV